jgi:hypothetical protein
MELYMGAALTALLGSGVGSFLGSYLKRKGENLATHEDIGRLVDQVSAVTQATKGIEAKISDEVWNRQRQWEMKRDALLALAKAERAAGQALTRLDASFTVAKGFPVGHRDADEATTEATKAWLTASSALDEAMLQVSLVCEAGMGPRCDSLINLLRTTAMQISEGKTDLSQRREALDKEKTALFKAVRKELLLNESLGLALRR